MTLIRAAKALDALTLSTEQDMGVNIIRRAVEEPLRMISKNAGVEGSIVVQNIKENAGSYGYNAATLRTVICLSLVSSIHKGCSTRARNAASVAGLMITTEALIADKPEDKKAPAAPAGGGMPDYDF